MVLLREIVETIAKFVLYATAAAFVLLPAWTCIMTLIQGEGAGAAFEKALLVASLLFLGIWLLLLMASPVWVPLALLYYYSTRRDERLKQPASDDVFC